MRQIIVFFLSIFLFLLPGGVFSQKARILIEGTPDWVTEFSISPSNDFSNKPNAPNYYFLEVNKQENVQKEQVFRKYMILVLNSDGISEISDITVDFDPSYQKLIFHSIKIIRDGLEINKLNDHLFKIVQREQNLERHLYDGSLTAIMNLKDVRVGDIIEYSFSKNGFNPIYEGYFEDRIFFQFSVPVEHIFSKLIIPKTTNLQYKCFNDAPPPKIEFVDDCKVLTWEKTKVDAIIYDINTPSWCDFEPFVSISQSKGWEDIVNLNLKWYSSDSKEKENIRKILEGHFFLPDNDSFIKQAIRFTQDEIRYLGFEDGVNAQKPFPPSQVLNQRYGDCKSKSFLLCEILNLNGIEAYPVLVNASRGMTLINNLPTQSSFNHCIVQIKNNDRIYFVDPTISGQGGNLDHFYLPDYKKGLVIKPGEKDLTDLPFFAYGYTKVTETYFLDSVGKGATLHVLTRYTGCDADQQRSYFSGNNLNVIQKEYVDFYSILFSKISASDNIIFRDMREELNEFVVEELYVIDSIWAKQANKDNVLLCEFYPLSLKNFVLVKQSPQRSMPYFIQYPVNFEHQTVIKLPEAWSVSSESKIIEAGSFKYNYSVNYSDREINVIHNYKTFKSFIDPHEVDSFILKHDEILKFLTFSLSYNKSMAKSNYIFCWPAGIFALILLLVTSFFAFRIFIYYDIPVTVLPENSKNIGGWLILVGMGFCITPFKLFYDLYNLPGYFNNNVWSSLMSFESSSRNMLTGILMFFELIYNVVYLVFSILLVFLFFYRRSILPKFAILFYSVTTIILLIDTAAAFQLNPELYSEAERQSSWKEIFRSFISAAIWIPYFLLSTRVKETFTNVSPKNKRQFSLENELVFEDTHKLREN